jgi:hypothetical protein
MSTDKSSAVNTGVYVKRINDGRHHVFWDENAYDCEAENCRLSNRTVKELDFVCTKNPNGDFSCRNFDEEIASLAAQVRDENVVLSTDGSHAFFPISGIAMAKNTADEWRATKILDAASDTMYCSGKNGVCQKTSSFNELKKLCRSNRDHEFCTFVDDKGVVQRTDLGIMYHINLERYLNNLGKSMEDDSDETRAAKEHFKTVTRNAAEGGQKYSASPTYVHLSLYRALGNIARIPDENVRNALEKLYEDSHPMLKFETPESCRLCASAGEGYHIVQIGVYHDRQFATVCYNGVTLRMYRSFSGCLWHLMVNDVRFIKHKDSYTTGLLMDIELQRRLARYRLQMTAPLKKRCLIELAADEEMKEIQELDVLNKGNSKDILRSLEEFGTCGDKDVKFEVLLREATTRKLTSAQNILEKGVDATLTYKKQGNVIWLTTTGDQGEQKKIVRRAYAKSILQNKKLEHASFALVRQGDVVKTEDDPVWLFLIDENVCVLNNEFGDHKLGSPYRMLQSVINDEMDKLYTCNLDDSQFLYSDSMHIELFAAWKEIPFRMNTVNLKGKRPEIPDLRLFYVEYTFPNPIRLPCFVQPLGEETLHERYRIYESVIPGGLWLCKPFEYKEQAFRIPLHQMVETATYFHVGQELNGLWPFHTGNES